MKRNCRTIYYCLYRGKLPILDDDGYETGEYEIAYGPAIPIEANVSYATGLAQTETFGNLDDYDKIVMVSDMSCAIDENTVLFIDKDPEFDDNRKPIYDYTIRRVAVSLNVINLAVRKVKVS